MKEKILAIIITLFLAALAGAEVLKLEVSGEAVMTEGDTSGVRNQAIQNSITAAMKIAMERLLPAKIISENTRLIEENIYSRKFGYIDNLEIAGFKQKNGSRDVFIVEAVIGIDSSPLEHDLDALGLMAFRESLPRILTVIQEKNIDQVHWHFQDRTLNNAESIIWKIFDLKGFFSGQQSKLIENINQETEQDLYGRDLKKIADIGNDYGVDILITGEAISRPVVTLELAGDSSSAVATVSLRAFRTQDGLELGASSISSTATGLGAAETGRAAISKAAEEAVLNILPGFLEKWEENAEPTIEITLFVSGLRSIESLVEFKNEFMSIIPGIKSLERRTFSGGAAAYDIAATADVKTIVEALNSTGLKSFDTEIRSFSSNSIDLKLKMR